MNSITSLLLPWIISLMVMPTHQVEPVTHSLFDGKTLNGWQVTDYYKAGRVRVKDGCIYLNAGLDMTGINWAGEFPWTTYEVNLEAMRLEGNDFFCAITFPVRNSFLSLVIGGWGGMVVGLSNIDGYDAANNFTSVVRSYGTGIWYPIRLRVTQDKVEAWVGKNDKVVDFEIGNYRLSLRAEIEPSVPFGFATWKTTGVIRNITLTELPAQ